MSITNPSLVDLYYCNPASEPVRGVLRVALGATRSDVHFRQQPCADGTLELRLRSVELDTAQLEAVLLALRSEAQRIATARCIVEESPR